MMQRSTQFVLALFFCLIAGHSLVQAQVPLPDDIERERARQNELRNQPKPEALLNDHCATAQEVQIGQLLTGLSNGAATLGPGTEIPAAQPVTCIKSFENDMWFKFSTVPEYNRYEIIIATNECNTPAGLQALLIQTADCDTRNFTYQGCVNHESVDTIKIFLDENRPGEEFFVYVDGFDGTVCDYNLQIRGAAKRKITRRDYNYILTDYDLSVEPSFPLPNLDYSFENNSFSMSWEASDEDDLAFFVVERFDWNDVTRDFRPFANVVATIDPVNSVAGGTQVYNFTDYKTVYRERPYRYRILRVNNEGEISFSEMIEFEAQLVESFYVHEVEKGDSPGSWKVKYINRKAKTTFDCEVLDENRQILKAMQLKKEPARDGWITLDMSAYSPGIYFFRMSNGKGDAYIRQFTIY